MKMLISRKALALTLGVAVMATVSLAQAKHVCSVMFANDQFARDQFITESNTGWSNLGWFNDQMTSIKMYDGCSCTLYPDANFGGVPLPTLSANGSMANIGISHPGWNDRVSSIVCSGP